MADLQLIIGNKNYSSWSLRPWLALRAAGIEFDEHQIWLDTETAQHEKLVHSPAGRVPILKPGQSATRDSSTWDSLAIVETVAERYPDRGLWPAEPRARARARSLCCEMHSSFFALREHLPVNCRARKPRKKRSTEVQRDIDRILAIWTETRAEFGGQGEFLFGAFGIADAFFAPVVTRFVTYDVPLDGTAARWSEAVLDLPPMQEWLAAAEQEERSLPNTDAYEG